jgi:hypothetical protein
MTLIKATNPRHYTMARQEKRVYAQCEEQYNTKTINSTAAAEIWSSFIEFKLVF